MRNTYLVCYDVADDKRLRKVFRICRNYGNHLQYSVFECELTSSEKVELERELGEAMNATEDQALFVLLGPSDGRGDRVITSVGLPYVRFDAPCYVV